MQREAGKYLFDIRESIASIEQYLGKKRDFDDYKANKLVRRAVERAIPPAECGQGERLMHQSLVATLTKNSLYIAQSTGRRAQCG